MAPVANWSRLGKTSNMSTATITISPNIYHQIDDLAVKEKKHLSDVVKELFELGWQIKSSGLDLTELKELLLEYNPKIAVLSSRMEKVLLEKIGDKTLPSVREQLKRV